MMKSNRFASVLVVADQEQQPFGTWTDLTDTWPGAGWLAADAVAETGAGSLVQVPVARGGDPDEVISDIGDVDPRTVSGDRDEVAGDAPDRNGAIADAGAGDEQSLQAAPRTAPRTIFAANNGVNGSELWITDGTATGTSLLKDINPGANASNPQNFNLVNGVVLFAANNGTNGSELWTTDGTADGTRLFMDINSGANASSPGSFIQLGSKTLFTADNGTAGRELWVTDGTVAGTTLLKDINPGTTSSFVSNLIAYNGKILFIANDGGGNQIWQTDGTTAGTTKITNISNFFPGGLTVAGTKLVFQGTTAGSGIDTELWVTDGTATGTQLLKEINPGSNFGTPNSGSPSQFVSLGARAVFTAVTPTSGASGALWVTDGTATGTMQLSTAPKQAGGALLNGSLIYTANDNGNLELWKTDGVTASLIKDIVPGTTGSFPQNFFAFNGRMYFSASVTGEGSELWVTDGTATGTNLFKDINPGSGSALPANFARYGSSFIFAATDDANGRELWISDGTPTGTTLLANINPGSGFGNPGNLFTFDAVIAMQPPSVNAGAGVATFVEAGPNPGPSAPVAVAPGLTLSDPDSTTLASATVTIGSGFFAGQDVLGFVNFGSFGNIAGSYNAGTGVLTLTSAGATATLSQFQAALRAVTYTNTSDAPATPVRTISFVVNDGNESSAVSTRDVQVVPTNDAPTSTGFDSVTFTEGQAYVQLDTGFDQVLTDPDSPNFDGGSLTVRMTNNAVATEDAFGLLTGGTSFLALSGNNVTYNGVVVASFSDASDGDPGESLIFTFNANASLQAVQTVMRNLAYVNVNSKNPSTATRTVGYTLTDGDGGTLNLSSTVNVVAVNDAPSGTNSTVSATEDTRQVLTTANFGFADVDGNSLDAVRITTVPTRGALYYDTDGAGGSTGQRLVAGDIVSASAIAAGQLVYVPNADANGTDSFTFQVRDDGGTANGGANLDPTSNTLTFTVQAVNDAPVNTVPGAIAGTEDVAVAITGISVDDADAGDQLYTTLSTGQGTLRLGITAGVTFSGGINGGDSFTVSSTDRAALNAALGSLTFTPTGDYNGAATISVITRDRLDGSGLSDAETITVNLAAVRDTPTIQPVTVNEDSGAIRINVDLSGFEGTITGVTVTPRAGTTVTYSDSGTADRSDDFFTFTPGASFNGDGSFTYSVSSGGVDETATVGVTVTSINDLPTIANLQGNSASYTENASARVPLDVGQDALVTDADNNGAGNFNGGSLVVRVTNAMAGDQLWFGSRGGIGAAAAGVTYNGTVFATFGPVGSSRTFTFNTDASAAAVQALIRAIEYINSTAQRGTDRAIEFVLTDGAGGSVTNTTTVVFNNVNDAPAGADNSASVSPTAVLTFTAANFSIGFTDIDGDAFAGIRISSVPTAGTLRLNGVALTGATDVLLAQLNNGALTYTPAANAANTTATFGFQVRDNGGTANGGIDLDQSSNTFMVTVLRDAPPTAVADSLTTVETAILSGNVLTNDTDADGGPKAIQSFTITSNGVTTAGTLGQGVELASGARLMVNADGSFTYNPNTVFEYLAAVGSGATNTSAAPDRFTYMLNGDSSAVVTFTVTGIDNDDRLDGTAGSDALRPGAGNDRVNALGGNDVIYGGSGQDLYDGGAGSDTVDYSATTQGVRVRLVEQDRSGAVDVVSILTAAGMATTTAVGIARGAEIGSAALIGVENIVGGSGDDVFDGNAGNNVLSGGGGNDLIYGSAGRDLYDGGAGSDTLDYSATTQGVRIRLVEQDRSGAVDVVSILSAAGISTTTAVGIARGAEIGSAALIGVENVVGGSGDDVFDGTAGNNILSGGGGNDLIYGSAGRDLYDGGAGSDTVDYSATTLGVMVKLVEQDRSGAVDVVSILSAAGLSTTTAVGIARGAEIGSAALIGVENIVGGSGSDVFVGGVGANALFGDAGDDVLIGGRGADRLEGGSGRDTFVYDGAADSTDTGGAYDTLIGFSFAEDRIDLGAGPGTYHLDSTTVRGSLSAETLGSDLAGLLGGTLTVNGVAFVTADGGSLAGQMFMVADTNGVAGYQAGEDLLIHFDAPVTPPTNAAFIV